MKHIKTSKGIINLEKKWSHLKNAQKERIKLLIKNQYNSFYNKNQRYPNKIEKNEIINDSYNIIREELGIYIPYIEYKKHVISIKVNKEHV